MSSNPLARNSMNGAPEGFLQHVGSPPPPITNRQSNHSSSTPVNYHVDLKTLSTQPSSNVKSLWLGVKHVVQQLFGVLNPIHSSINYAVSKGALESSLFTRNTNDELKRRKDYLQGFINDNPGHTEKFTVNVTNEWDVKLDGLTIHADPPSEDYLVVFEPNGSHYEDSLIEAKRLGSALNKNVVVFSYRGVGESTGDATRAKDLVNDGKAILEMLRSKGVPMEKVTLYGHSLGGGVAASIVAKNPQYQAINLIVDRSFSSFSKAAGEIVSKQVGKALGFLARSFFENHDWNLNTAKNLRHINPDKVLVLTNYEDRVLAKSSLSRKLPPNITNQEIFFEPTEPVASSEWKSHIEEIKTVIPNIKTSFDTLRSKELSESQRLYGNTPPPGLAKQTSESSESESITEETHLNEMAELIHLMESESQRPNPNLDLLNSHFKTFSALMNTHRKSLEALDLTTTSMRFGALEMHTNRLGQSLETANQSAKTNIAEEHTITIHQNQHMAHLASDLRTLLIFRDAVRDKFSPPAAHLPSDEDLP